VRIIPKDPVNVSSAPHSFKTSPRL
jgi:hypothetical protein